jgi:hypothetical protein
MGEWIGRVAASRTLERGTKNARPVRVRVGHARRAPEGDWECRYEIVGIGKPRRMRVFGVDGLQAMPLAMVALRSDLETWGKDLRWLEWPAYRGVPEQVSTLLPEDAARRVSRVIKREMKRFGDEVRRRYRRRTREIGPAA